jgi:hypothetical protein
MTTEQAIKLATKRTLLALPLPLARGAVAAAGGLGLLTPTFRTYARMGMPTRVLSGPFRGMAYQPFACGSAWLPKILGTYELELHPTIAGLAGAPCDALVDVGAAEGYYAVGLARLLDAPRAFCFDTDPLAPRLMARIAELNGVGPRLQAGGMCRPADLEAILSAAAHPLVVSDCEGGELPLLDPQAAPALARARLLVEVHDYDGADDIGSALRRRFEATHDIEAIPVAPRTPADFPEGVAPELSPDEKVAAMHEWRCNVPGWLVFRPRTP